MATYTQTDGTEDACWFQDVQISPATLKDGTLFSRLDTKRYPQLGSKFSVGPLIGSVSPATLRHGQGATLTITGGDFTDASVVTFSGSGITVVTTENVDHEGSVLIVTITTDPTATVGARNVIVTDADGGVATATGALTLTANPVTVTTSTPNTFAHSTTGNVTIAGTGFAAGATVTISGSGVTTNTVTVSSATSLLVNLTAASGAATTARDVTVTNTDTGTATATGALTIT